MLAAVAAWPMRLPGSAAHVVVLQRQCWAPKGRLVPMQVPMWGKPWSSMDDWTVDRHQSKDIPLWTRLRIARAYFSYCYCCCCCVIARRPTLLEVTVQIAVIPSLTMVVVLVADMPSTAWVPIVHVVPLPRDPRRATEARPLKQQQSSQSRLPTKWARRRHPIDWWDHVRFVRRRPVPDAPILPTSRRLPLIAP